jgi:hypothetical protein
MYFVFNYESNQFWSINNFSTARKVCFIGEPDIALTIVITQILEIKKLK